uniref:Putative farnesyl diphosphate synthase DDB_G0268742 n=1 Tax=Lygus hesperus TaxID=30085 RepID=A0A0A9Z921_LYGHE
MQDDYLDCYGDPAITKIGTDIRECKCTWLFTQAITLASHDQIARLRRHYGTEDDTQVKLVYSELLLPQHYLRTQQQLYESIRGALQSHSSSLPTDTLTRLLDRLLNRQK